MRDGENASDGAGPDDTVVAEPRKGRGAVTSRTPVQERIHARRDGEATGKVVDPLGEADEGFGVLVPLGPLLVELFPFLEILEISPDGRRNDGDWGFYCHSRIRSRYA
jgi:hypothetical protein